MKKYIDSHIRPSRLDGLPEDLRLELKKVRIQRGWTQTELGRRTGLPQTHISAIETGRIVPRFDTLLDLVRVLDRDLLMVPRELVPAVQALIRDYRRKEDTAFQDEEERPLYVLSAEPGSYGLTGGDAELEINLGETEESKKPDKPRDKESEENEHRNEI